MRKKDLSFRPATDGFCATHKPSGIWASGCTKSDAVSALKERLHIVEQRHIAAGRAGRRAARKAREAAIIEAFEARTGIDCSKIPRSSKAMKKILKEGLK